MTEIKPKLTGLTRTSNPHDIVYQNLLAEILAYGKTKGDRTGTGTTSLFGTQVRFDLRRDGFPLLTTKRLWWKAIVEELLWFLSGSTNVADLQKKGVTIWDEWATAEQCARFGREPGDLGPIYSHQWRRFGSDFDGTGGVDQIADVIAQIRKNPDSRRLIVTGWNPHEATQVALPPCHTLFQFYVADGELSCHLYQRSADVFLGVPYNIASYALLTSMIAHVCGLQVGDFVHSFGDVHIYSNHMDQVHEQLAREPKDEPILTLDPGVTEIDDFTIDHIALTQYDPHAAIKADIAV